MEYESWSNSESPSIVNSQSCSVNSDATVNYEPSFVGGPRPKNYILYCFGWCCRVYCKGPCLDRCAFHPPYPSNYAFEKNSQTSELHLKIQPHARCLNKEINRLKKIHHELFYVKTKKHNNIACMYIKVVEHSRCVVLFSHANAEDIATSCQMACLIGALLQCNVICYDYSGYGASSGNPSEANVYADIEAVYSVLLGKYSYSPKQVILFGQSIGSAPTVHLASIHRDIGAVILMSPLMSEYRVVCPKLKCLCCDYFVNITKVHKIGAKTLLIHGQADDFVGIYHSQQIHRKLSNPAIPAYVKGADHNDVIYFMVTWLRVYSFVQDLFPLEGDVAHSQTTSMPKHVEEHEGSQNIIHINSPDATETPNECDDQWPMIIAEQPIV